MTIKKVAVGLSGGVDSSVAAALLVEQGYSVTGVFIEAYNEPGCRTDQDKKDALQVALKLGIPFHVLDVREEYKEKVVSYFFQTYKEGRTPNPDVVCNREVKFGLFYDWALAHEFDAVATGHYARITRAEDTLFIQRAVDASKDQSYFLWHVRQDHLNKIIFPLGNLLKSRVREKAETLGFANAHKPDSMGICMIGELNVHTFLKQNIGENPGPVIFRGTQVGMHKGLWFHTIGQRGGFVIDKKILKKMGLTPESMEPLYVTGKDIVSNTLIIGSREEANRTHFTIVSTEYRMDETAIAELVKRGQLSIRIRNLGELIPVAAWDGKTIVTSEQLFGVAEGQATVFYAQLQEVGDEVIVAGGEISV